MEDLSLCAKLWGRLALEEEVVEAGGGGGGEIRAEREDTTEPRGPLMPAKEDTVACSSLILRLYSLALYSPSCSSEEE